MCSTVMTTCIRLSRCTYTARYTRVVFVIRCSFLVVVGVLMYSMATRVHQSLHTQLCTLYQCDPTPYTYILISLSTHTRTHVLISPCPPTHVYYFTSHTHIHVLIHLLPHNTGAFIAGIYSTSGWAMTTGVALGWGLGLSLFSLILNTVISCAPLYIFL